MMKNMKLILAALVAATAIASPALAQPYHQRGTAYYGQNGRFDPNSPALTGGGSLGGNRLMQEDTQ